ncbi:MAG TPA: molybdopterin cofactor-binding domain-containing protein [Longimicrobiales bacterium]|nr:molybdopterin cofactor-binding domain-containing protein [Longimicrobiales bacterium]
MATTKAPAGARILGSSIKRREDPRLITGRATFTDDVKLPGTTYAVFVRSPYAHALIHGIDASRALALPGVVAVYTGKELADAGVNPIPTAWVLPGIKYGQRRALALERARFVGEGVAMVVADDPYTARDAAELVDVDFEPLSAVVDAERALEPGAPQVYDDVPDNLSFDWSIGDAAAADAAFGAAAHVVRQRFVNQRLIPNAIEPRASLAAYNPATDELTLWTTSQNPHVHRLIIGAFALGIPEHKLRVISPDVGGGFGSKIMIYPDEVAVAWAARKLERPVKWTAERRESYLTDCHGRDHVTDAELALDADGRILALRVRTIANLGANHGLFGTVTPTYLYAPVLSGQYRIPTVWCGVRGVFTNTAPVDALRGAGRPEATFVIERLVDLAAARLGLDPPELRRRNFIPPEAFPYASSPALTYDSGDYAPALERALGMVGYAALRQEQARLRRQGRYLGIGLCTYVEACGLAPSRIIGKLGAVAGLYESGQVRVHPTGKVSVFTGSQQQGQGHETTFAQIAADTLGVPVEDVDVVHGDTGRIAFGMGTYGSRSGTVGGSAVYLSALRVRDKARKIAAHLLEAAEEDIEVEDGKYFVRGSPDRAKTFAEISLAAYIPHALPMEIEPGLDATVFFDPPNWVFPFGAHVAVVEVDAETGEVELQRYVAVDDVGNVVNPMIVDGQLHGGIAHGIGQALWEHAVYDDAGQLVTGSHMEYPLGRADAFPTFELDRTVTPSPSNPLGVKGVGEAGTIASPAAVANAVMDALAPFGITHLDMPYTPARVWQAIHAQRGR